MPTICVYINASALTHTYTYYCALIKLTHFRQWYPHSKPKAAKIKKRQQHRKRRGSTMMKATKTEHQKKSPESTQPPLLLPRLPRLPLPKWRTTAVVICRGNNLASIETYEFRHYFMNIIFSEERFIFATQRIVVAALLTLRLLLLLLFLMFSPQQGCINFGR